MKFLITGAAGFIGYHLSLKLLARGDEVVGIDNLNDYYDVNLKKNRLKQLTENDRFTFHQIDVADRPKIAELFAENPFDRVVHLAAQAGVRYSIENPAAYIDSNLVGFGNILEGCRHAGTAHLSYASSSSVYGANKLQPFSEHHSVDHPISLYAATKKANELMAHTYSHLYGLPTTGLRFFTVYGPWGRPDMALFKFTKGILNGDTIDIYNNGNMQRDFTYIDDIVEGVIRSADHVAEPNPEWQALSPDCATSFAPYRVLNIGNSQPVQLMDFVHAIENYVGKKAVINFMPMQDGDVSSTHADTAQLEAITQFKPKTSVETGIQNFVDWYRSYFDV